MENASVVDIEPSGNDKDVTKVGKNVSQSANRPKLMSKGFAKKIRIRAPQEKPSEAASTGQRRGVTVAESGAGPNVHYG